MNKKNFIKKTTIIVSFIAIMTAIILIINHNSSFMKQISLTGGNEYKAEVVKSWDISATGEGNVIATLYDNNELKISGNGKMKDWNFKYGDVDEDSEVTAYDATKVLRFLNGYEDAWLTEKQRKAADVNGDGVISEDDSQLILDLIVNKISKFPVEDETIVAIKKNIEYEGTVMYGDINGNKRVEQEDVLLLKQHLDSAIETDGETYYTVQLTNEQKKAADVNGNGEVDSHDFDIIKARVEEGTFNPFPVENEIDTETGYAPWKNAEIAKVTIENGITNIGARAFEEITGLSEISIANTVTTIGNGAFIGCTGLDSVKIPKSVSKIENDAFKGCSNLEELIIYSLATEIEIEEGSEDGTFANTGENFKIYCHKTSNIEEYVDANDIEKIIIDEAGPEVEIKVTPETWTNENTTIEIYAKDIASTDIEDAVVGLAEEAYSFDNGVTWQGIYDYTKTYTNNANGIKIKVRDALGNVTSKELSIVNIDKIVPNITEAKLSNTEWSNQDKTITITATDADSGIAGYALGITNETVPTEGWQTSNELAVTEDGTYYAWAKDEAGNTKVYGTAIQAKIDKIKPNIVEAEVSDGEWSNGEKTITMLATDDGGSEELEYAVSTENMAPESGWTTENEVTVTENGTYYLWVKDEAGNISDEYSTTIETKIDTTAPDIKFEVNEEDITDLSELWYNEKVQLNVIIEDNESGIYRYTITNNSKELENKVFAGEAEKSSTYKYEISNSGKTNITVTATDMVGNKSEKTIEINIDKTLPTISKVEISEEEWSNEDKTITITATDADSGILGYAISTEKDTPPVVVADTNEFTISENGIYYAWVMDKAGNTTVYGTAIESKIDKVAPTISKVEISNTEWSSENKTITITATDADSGIAGYAISTSNSIVPNVWQTSKELSITEDGTYYAWVEDNAGNTTVYGTAIESKIDKVAPTISDVELGAATPSNDTIVTIIANDDVSGIAGYGISTSNSVAPEVWQTSNKFTLENEGTYYAWAKDNAGNTAVYDEEIIIEDEEEIVVVSSDDYTVTEERIEGISLKTAVINFIEKITTNAKKVEVFKGENKVQDNAKVGTGMELRLNDTIKYTLLVLGDCDGDGESGIRDMARINNYRLYKTTDGFGEIYQKAADVNNDGTIDIKDMIMINNYRLYGTEF